MQRCNIGNRSQCNKIKQAHQIGLVALFEIALNAQGTDKRNGEQKGYSNRCQVPVSRGNIILVQAIGIHQRSSTRELGRTFVVIHDNNVDTCIMRLCQRFMGHCAAVDCHNQAGATLSQFDQCLSARPVSFQQAIRNVVFCIQFQLAEQLDKQSRTGGSVNVVVAVNRDFFLS